MMNQKFNLFTICVLFVLCSWTTGSTQISLIGTPVSIDPGGTVSTPLSFTSPAGTDRLVVVFLSTIDPSSNPTVTYNGQGMTLAVEAEGTFNQTGRGLLFYLPFGTSGAPTTANVSVSGLNANTLFHIGAAAFNNVAQTGTLVSTQKLDASGQVTSSSLTIPTSIGNLLVDHWSSHDQGLPNQTGDLSSLNIGSNFEENAYLVATANSHQSSYSFNINERWGHMAAEFAQAIATAPEMDITDASGDAIADGANLAATSTSNDTDFGSICPSGNTSASFTYTITNSGNANLDFTGSPLVEILDDPGNSGTSGDFSVTSQIGTDPLPHTTGNTTTFTVQFDPSAFGTRSATVSIANNDSDENPYTFVVKGTGSEPTVQISIQGSSSVAETGGSLVYRFTRDCTFGAMTVNFTVSGTATDNGVDYSIDASPANITYNPGTNTGTITMADGVATLDVGVNINSDLTVEGNETCIFTINTGSGYTIGTAGNVTGTILDDDVLNVQVSMQGSASTSETGGTLTYRFTRNGDMGALMVNFSVSGTATDGSVDYTVNAAPANITYNPATNFGSITIADGSATADISINTVSDTDIEGDETCIFNVENGAGYDVGTANTVTGTILDDDYPNVASIVRAEANPSNETDLDFTVTFSDNVNNVDIADFVLTTTGSVSASVNSVSHAGGAVFTVNVNNITGTGTLRLDLDDNNTITQAPNGSPLGGPGADNGDFTSGESYDIDNTGPTVTINQGGSQGDPTGTSPIVFDVVFSDVVTDFVSSDVTVGGTAGATTAVVNGSGTNYTVSVSGMTMSGTVNATIGANVATDALGNNNTASTSTDNEVTYTLTPQIEVSFMGNIVQDGAGIALISTANGTDFENVCVVNSVRSHYFTITNNGNANLTISGVSGIAGHTSDFTILQQPMATIGPNGGTGTLGISFEPTAAGNRSATIRITNDASPDTFFDFLVAGVGDAVTTPAAAGDDIRQCEDGTFTMNANTPVIGTGIWTKYSGSSGTITNPADPATTITGVTAGSFIILKWTITNGACASGDLVRVYNDIEPTGSAGANQSVCSTSTNLDATASGGTGMWTITGVGDGLGSIATPGSPTSTFSGTAGQTYTLRWTITNGACSIFDEVDITFGNSEVSVSVNPVMVDEDGTTNLEYTFSRNCALTPITVNFDISGTATLTSDYTQTGATTFSNAPGSGTVNMGIGESTVTIIVDPVADQLVELDETLILTLTAGAGYSISAPSVASGTIDEDDDLVFDINDVSMNEGGDGTTTTYTFTVTMDKESDAAVSVDFATADDTAEDENGDGDYQSNNGTVNFSANGGTNQTQTVSVTVNGDCVEEADEDFFVNLSNIQAGGRTASFFKDQGVGTILNDEATVSITDVTLMEGTGTGTTIYVFEVTRTMGGCSFTIDYATQDGTATTADNDYVAKTGTVTFTATGSDSKNIVVIVNKDAQAESDETFSLVLSNPSIPVTFTKDTGTGTIQNDDGAKLTIDDVSIAEGTSAGFGTSTMTFTVTLDANVSSSFTVDYTTADGTAQDENGDIDYIKTSGTLNFAGNAGETQTIDIPIWHDTKVELDEHFFVNLSNVQGGGGNVTISDSQGQGTIQNDDSSTLSVNDVSMTEGDSGTKTYTFTVTSTNPTDVAFTVDYATADNSATTADNDYDAANGTLNFAGNTGETQTFNVTVNGDCQFEVDEVFNVDISNVQASGRDVTISDAQGDGTIQNDDTQPTFSSCPNAQLVHVDASCQHTLVDYTGFPTFNTNCPGTNTIVQNPMPGTSLGLGTHLLTITGTDAGGATATCSFNITVQDNLGPDAQCQNISVFLNPNPTATITPTQIDAGSTDNCTPVTLVSVSPNSFDCTNLGDNTVTLTVEDANNIQSTCTATVNVIGVAVICYLDSDGDSYGDLNNPQTFCLACGTGYVDNSTDCNDGNAAINPGAVEICDGLDNDCDGTTDEGFDADMDGVSSCMGDCDDNDPNNFPGNAEVCDGLDNDCDGTVDEGFDVDGDGVSTCMGDCDDNDINNFPGNTEICDGLDNDCDGTVDEGFDVDGDGVSTCMGDCDDNDPNNFPGNPEVCDGQDNDCDGMIDEGGGSTTFVGNIILMTQAQVDAFSSCISVIDGDLAITGTGITNLAALSNLVEVTGDILISMTGLSNLNGLNNLGTIGMDLTMTMNASLNSISHFSTLTTLGGSLTMMQNVSLTSLMGLQNVTAIGGGLTLYANTVLADCCPIEPLLPSGIGGMIFIFGNATGCETQPAITMACNMAPLTGNPTSNCPDCPLLPSNVFQLQLEVYPNPSDGEFTLQLNQAYEKGTAQLIDITGRVVLIQQLDNRSWTQTIQANHLQEGIYMLVVKADKKMKSKRVVIK